MLFPGLAGRTLRNPSPIFLPELVKAHAQAWPVRTFLVPSSLVLAVADFFNVNNSCAVCVIVMTMVGGIEGEEVVSLS